MADLDELFAELESEAESKPQRSWSLDEIDALLTGEGSDDIFAAPKKSEEIDIDDLLGESEEEPTVEEIIEDVEEESTVETVDEEPEFEEEVAEEPEEEPLDEEPEFVEEEEETEEVPVEEPVKAKKGPKFQIFNLQLGRDKKKKEILEQVSVEEPEDEVAVEQVNSVSVNDDDLVFEEEDIAPAVMPRGEEKTVVFDASKVIKSKPASEDVAEPVDDELDAIDFDEISEESHFKSQDQTQVIMALAEDEDILETEVPTKEQAVAPETEEEIRERKALAQKTVGIHPIRNDSIDHQIMTVKVEKSPEGAIETNKYRERFLNVPKQHLERTADYEALHQGEDQGPIERAGRIVKKSQFKNTEDLEPVPLIVSAHEEHTKTIVAQNAKKAAQEEKQDDLDGQIKLTGFGEEEAIDQIDEENAEEALREKRDKQVAEFKLNAEIEDEEEYEDVTSDEVPVRTSFMASFIDDEYENAGDESRIRASLDKAVKMTGIAGIIQIVLTIVAMIIGGIVTKNGGSMEAAGGTFGCIMINLVILIAAAVCGASTMVRGFTGLLTKKLNAASGTVIVVLACVLEDLVMLLFTSDSYATVGIYTAAACVALVISSVARFITLLRASNNFAFVTNGTQLYSTEKISGEDDAFEIGRGLLIGDPEICYNARMERPSYFIENSFEDDPADTYADRLIFISLIAGALFGFIFGIVHKDIVFAFGTFAAVCSIAIPSFLLVASNINLLLKNIEFNKNGAAIVGHRAIEDSTDANAYVFDATDIFKKGSCSILGIKTFHGMRIDDAILYAAALVIESGGPLADIFDDVILGKKDLLPPVESLAYEEKLGLSAWIHGRRVLFGTRDLLKNHNVEAPDKEFEAQYLHDGRKLVYLAIAGKIAAMFVVKYHPDKTVTRYLRRLDRAGVSILVRSCDCNITEEMICQHFNLPLSAVKILSPVSGDIFQVYREEDIETAPAGIIHNGTLESSVSAFYEARELSDNIYVNKLVATIYTGMAILFVFILSLIGGAESMGVTAGQIVAFQLLWSVIAAAVPVLKRRIDR
ncbi:MAG: hypothetical protein Q4F70_02335 [Clostridia bacterium]|nr:hypothetical protein [Clostridia bacterium]